MVVNTIFLSVLKFFFNLRPQFPTLFAAKSTLHLGVTKTISFSPFGLMQFYSKNLTTVYDDPSHSLNLFFQKC